MHVDVAQHLGAVTRVVTQREHEGRPARVVIATRTYDTDPADLWHALTSAERIPRWLMPVSGELRLGGRYQLHGNAGGTVTRCEPPETLGLTWEFGGDVSWVTVSLSAAGAGRTALRLEHVAHVPEDRWTQFGPSAVGAGWEQCLLGLALHVAGGVSSAPAAEGAAWAGSPEGHAYIRGSCEGWANAAILDGEAPAQAAAAAARTFAAYTGTEVPESAR